MKKEEVLFYSNHYKRCWFFEDTVRRIADAGYKWAILLTGSPGPFRHCHVDHPRVKFYETSQTSYDSGMVTFKRSGILLQPGVKYLVHIDNDCFLNGIQELEEYLEEFVDGGYDYACHLVGNPAASRYPTETHIAHVFDQKMIPSLDTPDTPTPDPHYENAYQAIRVSAYQKLTEFDVGHHRRFLAALHKTGAKMGAHKASYRWDYSNWGKEWFHVGHIFEKYLQLEANNLAGIQRYNPDSEFDLFRCGFFVAQERCYGNIYPSSFVPALEAYYAHMGGQDRALECWSRLTQGTCMENWVKYQ